MSSFRLQKFCLAAIGLVLASHGLVAQASDSAATFETGAIGLLTRDADVGHRTGGSVKELADYVLRLKAAGVAYFSSQPEAQLAGAYLVVVKPGKRARVWVQLVGRDRSSASADAIARALQEVEPPSVIDGPVVFSVSFRTSSKLAMPFPLMATAALNGYFKDPKETVTTDALIERAWPDP